LKIIEQNLIGMYITSFRKKDGKKYICDQGQIMGKFDNYLIVDIFSWLDGCHMFSTLVDVNIISKYHLFKTQELMKDWYQRNKDFYRDGIELVEVERV